MLKLKAPSNKKLWIFAAVITLICGLWLIWGLRFLVWIFIDGLAVYESPQFRCMYKKHRGTAPGWMEVGLWGLEPIKERDFDIRIRLSKNTLSGRQNLELSLSAKADPKGFPSGGENIKIFTQVPEPAWEDTILKGPPAQVIDALGVQAVKSGWKMVPYGVVYTYSPPVEVPWPK